MYLLLAQALGAINEGGKCNRLRHLPLLGLRSILRVRHDEWVFIFAPLGRHQHQRDLAVPLLAAAQNGLVVHRVAFGQVIDGAKGQWPLPLR